MQSFPFLLVAIKWNCENLIQTYSITDFEKLLKICQTSIEKIFGLSTLLFDIETFLEQTGWEEKILIESRQALTVIHQGI